jgi:CHRD domain
MGMALRLVGICVLTLVWAAGPAIAAEQFETRLSPSPLTDGTRINIMGEGRARAELDGNKLTVNADFRGLGSSATTAELYDGPGIGIPGPKAFDLTVTQAASGTVSGSVTLTSQQAAAVRHGHFYVQINSQKAPDGNLTGWLLPPHPNAGQDVPVPGPGFLPQFDVPAK